MQIRNPGAWRVFLFTIFIAGLGGCAVSPPIAKVVPTSVNLGGKRVVDNYWWLRNKSDPAVINYLKAENAYTAARMKSTQPLQQELYTEMLARIRETDETVPYRKGNWWYSSRTEAGKQYEIVLRRKGSPTAEPQVMLDVNELAAGKPFFDYMSGSVSDDENLLAYATDITGNRQYILHVKDLNSGAMLPDTISLVQSFA